jgi:hypothetical protein
MTYGLQINTTQDFSIGCIPSDLHAANWNEMAVFGRTEFSYEVTDFLVLNFRSKHIDNDCMEL